MKKIAGASFSRLAMLENRRLRLQEYDFENSKAPPWPGTAAKMRLYFIRPLLSRRKLALPKSDVIVGFHRSRGIE
jgi:hypothetical protein